MMSDDELGLDAFLDKKNDGLFISVTDDVSGEEKWLQLEPKPFVRQRGTLRIVTCAQNFRGFLVY